MMKGMQKITSRGGKAFIWRSVDGWECEFHKRHQDCPRKVTSGPFAGVIIDAAASNGFASFKRLTDARKWAARAIA